MARDDILERKNDILQWIEEGQSKSFICKQLQCKPETLNSYLKKMDIFYEGNQGLKGKARDNLYKTAKEYVEQNSHISSHRLREKLIKDGIKEYRCEKCGLSIWLNQPIPLELHHIDKNHYNNNFDNLQILCPNCHALENNNNNNNNKSDEVKLKPKKKIIKQKSKENIERKKHYCIDCGKEISRNALRCKSCAAKEFNKDSQKHSLSRDELKNLIRTTSFVQIGEQFGVTDNAIRKWCDTYNLPRTKKEINSFTDGEWLLI